VPQLGSGRRSHQQERDVIFEQRGANLARIKQLNGYLVELFIKSQHRQNLTTH